MVKQLKLSPEQERLLRWIKQGGSAAEKLTIRGCFSKATIGSLLGKGLIGNDDSGTAYVLKEIKKEV